MTHLITPCEHSDSADVWKKASDDSIAAHGYMDIEMFTDGSVVNTLGAGAADIYEKRLFGPNKVYREVAPAGPLCSSYKAEITGVQCGLNRLSGDDIIKENKSLFIGTDSQALIAALAKGPITQKNKLCSDIWSSCLRLLDIHNVSNIVFQFIKSHVGVEKNERVDQSCGKALIMYSKEKLGFSQRKSPILLDGVKAAVKLHLVQKYKSTLDTSKHRYLICGDNVSDLKLSATYSRTDEVLCSQLRVDRCTLMGSYGFMIKIRQSPLCRWCHSVNETVDHVFSECLFPPIIQLRQEFHIQDAIVLHKNPLLGL